MANDIDAILFDVESGLTGGERRMRARPAGISTTAHPFTEADLMDFAASGEHPGLD
jgi:hypothetical protein